MLEMFQVTFIAGTMKEEGVTDQSTRWQGWEETNTDRQ